jgi:hypothetical protein
MENDWVNISTLFSIAHCLTTAKGCLDGKYRGTVWKSNITGHGEQEAKPAGTKKHSHDKKGAHTIFFRYSILAGASTV